ncbi:MAG TPA: BamA/TamA family outer membrane protein [Longimicrobiales bacterium]
MVDLRFEGATTFDENALRAAIASRETECRILGLLCLFGAGKERHYVDDVTLQADELRIRLFYSRRGYREVAVIADTVALDDDAGAVRIVFHIDEGRPVRVISLDISGTVGIFDPDSAGSLPLQVGAPLSLPMLEATRDSLANALRNNGYPHAEVLSGYTIPAASPLEAQVRFEVIPGTPARFGEVEITGNRQVSDDVIRRLLTFHEGQPYRRDELLRSQTNLFGLDVFTHASIQPLLDAGPDSIIPIRVQVNEGDIHRVRVGAGVNEMDCVNAEGQWASRNFLGGARRLQLRARVANVLTRRLGGDFPCGDTGTGIYGELSGLLTADFTQPWFLGPRNTLGIGLLIERRSFPEIFVRNARGGHITVTRSLGSRTSLALGYRPELTRLESSNELFFCINFIACGAEQIGTLRTSHWLAPVALTFVRDRSNSPFTPTAGYTLQLDAEYAAGWTGSDFAYTRWVGDLSWYRRLASGVVLASHLRPGWARAFEGTGDADLLGLNPQKRFFAGGANSVRGFGQFRLGPKVLVVDESVLATPNTSLDVPWYGCTPEEIRDLVCDAGVLAEQQPGEFTPRPVGGSVLIEGNAEIRFPLVGDKWRGAAFVDFGQVWQDEDAVDIEDVVFTPGVGIRYHSPIGPIRLDVGYRPAGAQPLPLLVSDEDGTTLYPQQQLVSWEPDTRFHERLQFHFSIGQAF